MAEPDDSWISDNAARLLASLGEDAFAEAAAELRELLCDADFRGEINALVLLAVNAPNQVEDSIEALVSMVNMWACTASATLDMSGIILLMVHGKTIKANLRAGMN